MRRSIAPLRAGAPALAALLALACPRAHSAAAASTLSATVVSGASGVPVANANVTVTAGACTPASQVTPPSGKVTLTCPGLGREPSAGAVTVSIWARQFLNVTNVAIADGANLSLAPRPTPGFPASGWQFEGWAVEAQTGDVPGTDISFLAHPSAFRTPSGRVFLTSTANSHAGPGWTQAYWLDPGEMRATAVAGALITRQHPVIAGTPFTARMVFADGRLLMLIGMDGGPRAPASILENKNLADPSNPADWIAAEGDGHIVVNFTGAPTSKHEDYRLHVFEDGAGAPAFACRGVPRKYWLFVIPDGVPGVAGRACGRMGFASASLLGPYEYCGWIVDPHGTSGPAGGPTSDCDSWPGGVVSGGGAMYFVAGWGNIYSTALNASSSLGPPAFRRVAGDPVIAVPAPGGQYDDFRQIEYTFLPPAAPGGRWQLFHASYSNENGNPNATRADYGFKQAIGRYTFDWVKN